MHPLAVTDLVVRYGNLTAVNHVSFNVREGEIYGLLGPNGAGKTSIISTITTLRKPTEGDIRIFQYDPHKKPRAAKALTGYVPQELIHHGFFSLEEILAYYSGYYGIRNNQERIEYLIDRLELNAHRKKRIKQLSGGIKRRLLIAKALLHKPRLLLLDEPTAGVDIDLRLKLWNFVSDLRNEGTSILLTTHYLEEAEELCDRVGILDKGVLRMEGVPEKLIEQFTEKEVIVTLHPTNKQIAHQHLVHQQDGHLIFRLPATGDVGALLHQLQIELNEIKNLRIREGNLEKAFTQILEQPDATAS